MSRARSVVAVMAALLALGCGGGDSMDTDGGASVDARTLAVDASGPPPDAATAIPAGWSATPYLSETPTRTFASVGDGTDDGVDYGAMIVTDVGTLVIDLTETQTPITVGSFVFLARNHFYDGVAFHRVIDGFMAQGGDPNTVAGDRSTWGRGGPGYQFGLEIDPALRFDARGVLGMANAGPSSNGSQFFITFGAQSFLDGDYTVFGRLIEGDGALAAIAQGEPPATPTRITTVQIIQR